MNLKKYNILSDIYYSKEYISLYLKKNEELFEFEYKEDEQIFYNIAIKRLIDKIGNKHINEGYFDLETAYGYGGFYSNSGNKNFIERAMGLYKKRCIEENIIAEFIRFHPFSTFSQEHKEFFNFNVYDRDIVYVDLTLSKDKRWEEYSSNTRNILRKSQKELKFQKTDNLEMFIELYEKTMQKNNADSFYYFSQEYYKNLLENKDIELYEVKKDDETIASAFFMFSDEFGHYHLSANNYAMRKYNANYFMLDQLFDIAKNKGKKYFILGGGTTSDNYDSLLKFKYKFSSLTKPFYISGVVYNDTIYNRYKMIWEEQSQEDIKYFLKYRLEIK